MEIIIPGILLVALMVYVSTRIKKSAAAAYEPETVDNAEFTLVKPAGLMHPLRDDSEFAFEAYSNDYGDGNLRSVWQMQAALKVHIDKEFDDVRSEIKTGADEVLADELQSQPPAGQRICLIETENTVDGVKKHDFWKIVENEDKVYELKVSILDSHFEEKFEKAAAMIGSFSVR